MQVHVPAMRGKMGSRTYYSCMMPLNAVPQFFKFTDWSGMLPEDREQRVLVEKRIPELASYITENEPSRGFPRARTRPASRRYQ